MASKYPITLVELAVQIGALPESAMTVKDSGRVVVTAPAGETFPASLSGKLRTMVTDAGAERESGKGQYQITASVAKKVATAFKASEKEAAAAA